jgi:hypothetical protein
MSVWFVGDISWLSSRMFSGASAGWRADAGFLTEC